MNNGKGVCFRARDAPGGVCDIPGCQYDHDPAKLKEARRCMHLENAIAQQMGFKGYNQGQPGMMPGMQPGMMPPQQQQMMQQQMAMQQQQQQQPPPAADGRLDANALAQAPPHQQKQMLGERLYPGGQKILKGAGLFLAAVALRVPHPDGQVLDLQIEEPAKHRTFRAREARRHARHEQTT